MESVIFEPNSRLQTLGENSFYTDSETKIYCDSELKDEFEWPYGVTVVTEPTVTFEYNNGSDVDRKNVAFNDTVAKPADPTKDGYVFDG